MAYLKSLTLLALVFISSQHNVDAQEPDICYGPIIEVTATVTEELKEPLVLFGSLAPFGGDLLARNGTLAPAKLVEPSSEDACAPFQSDVEGAVLLVRRGNCSFVSKAWNAQQAGAAAMIVYNNEAGCIIPGYDNSTQVANLTLPTITISMAAGLQLQALLLQQQQHGSAPAVLSLRSSSSSSSSEGAGAAATAAAPGEVQVSLRVLQLPRLDSSAALLWLMAVGTLVAGALWGGADHVASKKPVPRDQVPLLQGPVTSEEIVDISPRAAVGFVFMASAMLLILYFFLNRIAFYILLFMFCLASVQSCVVLLTSAAQAVLPQYKNRLVELPFFGPTPLLAAAAAPVCITLSAVWAVYRNTPWSWLLQDFQGIALMLLVLRTLRLSSIKVACILLPLTFAYDVFWVFLSPLLFGGDSVMVEVARGGAAHEVIPMLLRVPRLSYPRLHEYSMLGFGDIILPGLLVAYTRRLDIDLALGIFKGYFLPCTLGYAAGLSLTYAALAFSWFGDQGQPALLYLVPCTLLPTLVLGWARGHAGIMWSGGSGGKGCCDHDSDAGEASEQQALLDHDASAEAAAAAMEEGHGRGAEGYAGEQPPAAAAAVGKLGRRRDSTGSTGS